MTSVGVAGAGATIALCIATITGFVWRTESKLDEKYLDRVQELQADAWSQTSSELRALFQEVEEMADQSNLGDGYEELDRSDRIEFYIQKEIDRGELANIEESLERIDTPRRLYEEMREEYESTIHRFGVALVFMIILSSSLLFPETEVQQAVAVISAVVVALGSIGGFDTLLRARENKKQLDAIWEEYYFDN